MRKPKFNFFAAIGMVVALGTVAFTTPKLENSSNWYLVEDGAIENTLTDEPGNSPFDDCSLVKTSNMCSIELSLDPSKPFPQNLEEAERDHTVGQKGYRN